jgi:hypothetical protein
MWVLDNSERQTSGLTEERPPDRILNAVSAHRSGRIASTNSCPGSWSDVNY